MNVKKILLIILLAVLATMLLQVNVKAEEVGYSAYDYLLTESGVVAQSALTGTESVIAGIKGEYTGEITADVTNKKVTINNFTAEELRIFDTYFYLLVEGVNTVVTVYRGESNEDDAGFVYGDGEIITSSYVTAEFTGYGEYFCLEEYGIWVHQYFLGDSINKNVDSVTIQLDGHLYDGDGVMNDEIVQKICNLIELGGERSIWINMEKCKFIPASIFTALEGTPHYVTFWSTYGWYGVGFSGDAVTGPFEDFTFSLYHSNGPLEGYPKVSLDNVEYVYFYNTNQFNGRVDVNFSDARVRRS